MGIRTKLSNLQKRYNLIENSTGKVATDEASVDSYIEIRKIVDGSDLCKFLRNPKEIYLVYWYYHNLATPIKKQTLESSEEETKHYRTIMQSRLKKVGNEMKNISFITLTKKVNFKTR